jgi:hypothetical protein
LNGGGTMLVGMPRSEVCEAVLLLLIGNPVEATEEEEDVRVTNPEEELFVLLLICCKSTTGAAGPEPPKPPPDGGPPLAGLVTHLPSPAAPEVCAHHPFAPRRLLQFDSEGTESVQVSRISAAQKEPLACGQTTRCVVVLKLNWAEAKRGRERSEMSVDLTETILMCVWWSKNMWYGLVWCDVWDGNVLCCKDVVTQDDSNAGLNADKERRRDHKPGCLSYTLSAADHQIIVVGFNQKIISLVSLLILWR